jgi:hypothetical protein
LADVHSSLSVLHTHIASTKDADEAHRRSNLVLALQASHSAAKCLSAYVMDVCDHNLPAKQAFKHAFSEEIQSGALSFTYPAGITVSVAHPELNPTAVASVGVAGSTAPADAEVNIFKNTWTKHGGADDSCSENENLADTCEILDSILQRVRAYLISFIMRARVYAVDVHAHRLCVIYMVAVADD